MSPSASRSNAAPTPSPTLAAAAMGKVVVTID